MHWAAEGDRFLYSSPILDSFIPLPHANILFIPEFFLGDSFIYSPLKELPPKRLLALLKKTILLWGNEGRVHILNGVLDRCPLNGALSLPSPTPLSFSFALFFKSFVEISPSVLILWAGEDRKVIGVKEGAPFPWLSPKTGYTFFREFFRENGLSAYFYSTFSDRLLPPPKMATKRA